MRGLGALAHVLWQRSLQASLNGFVPEAGDSHEDMEWDAMTDWDDNSWDDFVAEAVAATKAAQKELSAWQDENA